MDDEALMARFCEGDEASFNVLFERYSELVHAAMRRATKDSSLAKDLTQTTFLSVVRGRGRFTSGSRFRPWLFAIAFNALREEYRRRSRNKERVVEPSQLPELTTECTVADRGLRKRLQLALDLLPEHQREAVVLHQFAEFSFCEIAEMLGSTESTVKVRAHRGYQRLRKSLRDLRGDHV